MQRPLALLLLLACAPRAEAQSFVDNTTDIPAFGTPGNDSTTENVDFGDVDLDGDWDAVFADGGDGFTAGAIDQNRIWINQGNLQNGAVGVFVDETAARFPVVTDQSRDIELADIDGDGDLDIYNSNTSELQPDTNRWWINQGGIQSGQLGFYQDETNARWVGLGGPGSSIAPAAVLAGGGFQDWSCDCDFGDLDSDGDLDLVHSTYGGAFGGQVPTRIFLNDGGGFFSEFNPSGAQLAGTQIANGTPGLWCEGTQQANTTDATGTFCDIASTPLDIDLGDIDGDFDLDILHGARLEAPRMFANRLEASPLAPAMGGGALGFRDVTGMVFQPGYVTGNGHYEQEMGDFDGDGDLDIYGLNWLHGLGSLTDVTLRNTGSGLFDNLAALPGSQNSDGNEGDMIDYDGDGDLDIFACAFTGNSRLYQNQNNGGAGFSFTNVTPELPLLFLTFLDLDVCDVDGDGDYDVFAASDENFGANPRNVYFQNTNDVPDTTAPYLPNLEQVDNPSPGPDPTVVRVHVYDNSPYYIAWYNETWLEVSVGGGPVQVFPMTSSGGQVFRVALPGSIAGNVSYQAFSRDEYGNLGASEVKVFETIVPMGDCNGNGFPDVEELMGGPLDQWATAVVDFSSQYSPTNYSASQVLGPPNVFSYGANPETWSPATQNGGTEFIEVAYSTDVLATGVVVRETEGNGYVSRIDLVDNTGGLHTVFTGLDGSAQGVPVDFTVTFPETAFLVRGVRVEIDTSRDLAEWESIDAIRLSGSALPSAQDANDNGTLDSCENVGTRFCASSPNSVSAAGATMVGTGSATVSADDLVLAAGPVADGEPGLFYYGPVAIQAPFGNGFRCVGGTAFRLLPPTVSVGGVLRHDLDLSSPPPGGQIGADSTWKFQAWFRDPAGGGAGFNLSDGLSVTFLP